MKGGGGGGEERGRENSVSLRLAPMGGARPSGDDPTEQRQRSSTRSHQTYLEHHDGCTTSHRRSSRRKHGAWLARCVADNDGALGRGRKVASRIRSCSPSPRQATSPDKSAFRFAESPINSVLLQRVKSPLDFPVKPVDIHHDLPTWITFFNSGHPGSSGAPPPPLAIQGGGGRRDGDASAILLHAAPAHTAPASTRTRRLHGRRSARAGARRRPLPPYRAPTHPPGASTCAARLPR